MDKNVQAIVNSTNCGRHSSPIGAACFYVPGKDREYLGICDARAKKAGYNGKISKNSLTRGSGRR